MKRYFFFTTYLVAIIIKSYATTNCCCNECCGDCCDDCWNSEDIFLNNAINENVSKLKIEEIETVLQNNFKKITRPFNFFNGNKLCTFISTIQNIFRRDCYLNKLNECLEIVRNNIEEIDKDLFYGIYDLLMINNELFNANSKEETKNICKKYLTVSAELESLEEKIESPDLKFCDNNRRFIHYRNTLMVKVLFKFLNKILEIGNKKKIFILDSQYVFSYFDMNEKMKKNQDLIEENINRDENFNEILESENNNYESGFFIVLLDKELTKKCDIYNFKYNNFDYKICGMIKGLSGIVVDYVPFGTVGHAIAIVEEENKMNFYNDNEEEIFEYNPQEPWDYRFYIECLFFEKTDNASIDVNYNSYQYFIDKQEEEPFPIIYRNGKIYAILFEWHYLEGEENNDNPQILAYSWNKKIERVGKNNEDFFKEFIEKNIDSNTRACKLIDDEIVYISSCINNNKSTIENLKECYSEKNSEDYGKLKHDGTTYKISSKSFLEDFWENNLSHCDFYNASILYKDLGKDEFFSKTKESPHLAKTILNGKFVVIYDNDDIKFL